MPSRPRLKVRTGCRTCKDRKIKCDETKPSCRRCSAFGRVCGGYGEATAKSDLTEQTCFDVLISNTRNNDELHWLEHFSARTGPSLSDCPDSQAFWSRTLPQMSTSVPSIRHALLAVSSCHAAFTLQSSTHPHAFQYQDYVVKQYNLAIKALRLDIGRRDTSVQVPLICCLLFICIECLMGNTALILTHLKNGQKILGSSHFDQSSTTLISVKHRLDIIFGKFGAQSTYFSPSVTSDTLPPTTEDMHDTSSARAALDVLITACMCFVKQNSVAYGADPAETSKQQQRDALLQGLLAWEERMRELEQQRFVSSDDASVLLLYVRQHGTYLYVALCLNPRQTFCDMFLARFRATVDFSERLLAVKAFENETQIPFSLESSIIPALWLTATKCRDTSARHRAVNLLKLHRGREGLWDARLYAKAAERVVAIEESRAKQPEALEEHLRIFRSNVVRTNEDRRSSAQLLVHTAPHGYHGDKVTQIEDFAF